MEAKDTVMSDKEINVALKDYPHYFYDSQGRRYEGYWAVLKIALKAQDKISWEAGYKQSREEMDIQLTSLADLCLEHRKGGRREVVEFVLSGQCLTRAKLKEWGIPEPEIDEAQELADLRHNASDDTIG